MCFIVQNIGDQLTPEEYKDNYLEFWGWNENKEEAIKRNMPMQYVIVLINMDMMALILTMSLILVIEVT